MIPPEHLMLVGSALAVVGSFISILGACYNNLLHEHRWAMNCWMVSNVVLLVWSAGFAAGVWNGGLSGIALVSQFAVFMITNAYGLMKYRR